jgi:hypothetical protein
MKKLFVLALLFIFTNTIFGQAQQQTTRSYIPIVVTADDLTTTSEAKQIIQEIIDAVGIKSTVNVAASTKVPNAAAAMYKNKRYIFYNPAFVAAIGKVSGESKWTATAIFAHELGHHFFGHTDKKMSSSPDIELEADAFTGYALRKMGATLEESQLSIRMIASRRGSFTHPARHDRLEWIAAGWSLADEQLAKG